MADLINRRVRVYDRSRTYEGVVVDFDKDHKLITVKVDEQFQDPPRVPAGVIVSIYQARVLGLVKIKTDEYQIRPSDIN